MKDNQIFKIAASINYSKQMSPGVGSSNLDLKVASLGDFGEKFDLEGLRFFKGDSESKKGTELFQVPTFLS